MAPFDLIFRGGMLVLDDGVVAGDVAVAEGRIVEVGPEIGGGATEEIDAAGLHVLPGAVDPHVHFDEPGRADWEGFATGSRAFAAGGGTTFFDMPLNASPPTVDAASFDLKLAAGLAASATDFALWGGLVPGNLDRLDELAARGAVGFKAFMSRTGTDDFPPADDLTLWEGMRRAARLGLPVAVHCENDAITAGLAGQAVAGGRTAVRDYLASRPAMAEIEAIGRALAFAREAGCSIHVVHVSTGAGAALVARARAAGVDATCEVCAHHLALTDEDAERIGAAAKCAPPLRPQAEVEALWERVAAGTVPMIASDHSPAPPALKAGDAFAAWGGVAGIQSTLAVALTEGHAAGGVPLPRLAAALAGNAARRFRLASKGRLAVGYDADLVLVDLAAEYTLRREDLLDRHRSSPFVGRRFRGQVTRTLVRGWTVFRDGVATAGAWGRLVRPEKEGVG